MSPKMSPSMRANIEESKGHIRTYQKKMSKKMSFEEKVLQDQFALALQFLNEDQLALVVAMMCLRK